jgi:hypothetical protein
MAKPIGDCVDLTKKKAQDGSSSDKRSASGKGWFNGIIKPDALMLMRPTDLKSTALMVLPPTRNVCTTP